MRSSSLVVMEDRKRPVPHDPTDDSHHPHKRQAVQSSSATPGHHMPQSQEDVVNFQKEAIWRQMQEYKRERNILESRVEELENRSVYHDDHIRVVDAWWTQLLEEVQLLAGESKGTMNAYQNGDTSDFPTTLLFDDVATFTDHLKEKRDQITSALKQLFATIQNGAPMKAESDKIDELQLRIRELLVDQKANKVEIARLEKEVEGANARLTDATMKYLTAEKKADRLRSQTVSKIERQARSGSTADAKEDSEAQQERDREVNAKVAEGHVADVEAARKEMQAVANKQKEDIQKLQAENSKLSEQVTNFTIKFGRLTEEEISNCDAYKNLKTRLEDLATRYNHIEATNKELAEKAEVMESERTSFKEKILAEQEHAIADVHAQMARTETDLARIRTIRDELVQDQQLRKLREEQKFTAIKEVQDLVEARAARIDSLELEVQRLKALLEKEMSSDPTLADLNLEQLRQKYEQLDKSYKILSNELPGLEQAFKKAHELGTKKVAKLEETEEKLKRLLAEKNKAESKYFAAMKAKEALMNEAKAIRKQNSSSTEIITQLKEAEKRTRDIVYNLEKQLAELKTVNQNMLLKNKETQSKMAEQTTTIESLKTHVTELGNQLRVRDGALSKEVNARREAEVEITKLNSRLTHAESRLEVNKPKESEDSQLEALKQIALCAVCRNRFKNTAIRTCGHVFCKQCADERIASRSRKCPNCGRGFAATDLIPVHL